MKYLIKALTKKMVTQLRKGRAIELSQNDRNICSIDDYKSSMQGYIAVAL